MKTRVSSRTVQRLLKYLWLKNTLVQFNGEESQFVHNRGAEGWNGLWVFVIFRAWAFQPYRN